MPMVRTKNLGSMATEMLVTVAAIIGATVLLTPCGRQLTAEAMG